MLVLTQPQAVKLIVASFSGDESVIKKALGIVKYYMKNNAKAYKSHSKKSQLLHNFSLKGCFK
jgi:hypothetical protein